MTDPSRRRLLSAASLLFALCAPAASHAEPSWWERETLTGSWGGRRSALADRGVEFAAAYTGDVVGVVSGGVERDAEWLSNIDLQLAVDLESLVGWRGARVFLYGLGTHGGNPSRDVGDFQVVDNIEANDTWKVFEAWLEQRWLDGRISMLAGLFAVDSRFDVVPAADLFVHSSPGTGPIFGSSGRNAPSIFPVTSLALEIELVPTPNSYLRTVVADGVPGDRDRPGGTRVRFDEGDGVLLVTEIGLLNPPATRLTSGKSPACALDASAPCGLSGQVALGGWGYTGRVVDRERGPGDPELTRGSYGFYAFASQRVRAEASDPTQGLNLYLRVGFGEERTNDADAYIGGGLVYDGPIDGRDSDRIGFAVGAAHFGDGYRATSPGGRRAAAWEIGLELTYRIQLTPWFFLQPDLQLVIDPSGRRDLAPAWVLLNRAMLMF